MHAGAGRVRVSARLDVELVRRGLARSRAHAARLVAEGRVRVAATPARRPSAAVGPEEVLEVVADTEDPGYASRAAHKLDVALESFVAHGVSPAGRRCLDVGASTGGFTDVLLRRGAAHVVAVDVGHDQMVPRLRADARVEVREGVNARSLRAGDVDPAPDLVVGDLSFISLRLVLGALLDVCAPGADLVLLVKPQFEVGRERLGPQGVVRDPELWRRAVADVCADAAARGATVRDVQVSALPGVHGNVEFVLLLRAPGPPVTTGPSPAADVTGDAGTPTSPVPGMIEAAVAAAREGSRDVGHGRPRRARATVSRAGRS
ncbi:hemolysin [Cellulomonas oligotrophica]|uniref:TlyA family rRNA (Cytidine-2'-O)-methyltransferase n=1 Tax=Cellulomonas oligotrophica TaxID=931536 RepID=A0ABQ4D768_9CELL|nr:TlyA family rRNA (cytidine-2'-O)-methyltransferase [Cellulomonas oligotrophica]